MKIQQEIDLNITPEQIVRYIYEYWAGEDLIDFLNECGKSKYASDWDDLIKAAEVEDLNINGRIFIQFIYCTIQRSL